MEKKSKKSTKPAAAQLDPISIALHKYEQFEWKCFRAPKNSINDIIASKGQKLHFVQVITKEISENPRYSGESRNIFIQNAFSNMAIPVFAYVTAAVSKTTSAGEKTWITGVTFEDVNANKQVIIGSVPRAKKTEDTKNESNNK